MSFLSSTAKLVHSSSLPDGATQQQGIAMLQDHSFFLECDPHMQKFEALGEVPRPSLPPAIKALGATTLYKVTDIVESLPRGLWGSTVESRYEFTNLELGLFVRIRSPMSVVMDTLWEIKPKHGGAVGSPGLELVEDCHITCSKLLIGIVKSLNEGGWPKIHTKMLHRLQNEIQTPSTDCVAA